MEKSRPILWVASQIVFCIKQIRMIKSLNWAARGGETKNSNLQPKIIKEEEHLGDLDLYADDNKMEFKNMSINLE